MNTKSSSDVDISVIIPVFDEVENVSALHAEVLEVLERHEWKFEIIFVDDGSTDGTFDALKSLSNAKVIRLKKNFGQSAALRAGFDNACGRFFVTMDGDRQNDPNDIPMLFEEIEKGFDVVCGWRASRKDSFGKRMFSKISNRLRRRLTGELIHDSGCSLRIYRSEVACDLELQGEMHRYIPALLYWRGYKIGETKVNHRPREHGRTKYGKSRLVKGFLDLLFVTFWYRFSARPLHLFGGIGFLLGFIGSMISGYLILERLILNTDLSDRPLFTLSLVTVMLGIQMFTMGILAEYLSRIHYASTKTKPYVVDSVLTD